MDGALKPCYEVSRMKASLTWVTRKVEARRHLRMDQYTKANGLITSSKDMASSSVKMASSTMDSGHRTKSTVTGPTYTRMG